MKLLIRYGIFLFFGITVALFIDGASAEAVVKSNAPFTDNPVIAEISQSAPVQVSDEIQIASGMHQYRNENPTAALETEINTQVCFLLMLEIDGGPGTIPDAIDPNCPGDETLYAAGTVVTLMANPGEDSSVYRWRGTDDDSSLLITNTVTMTADMVVGIHYIHHGDPHRPVYPNTPLLI